MLASNAWRDWLAGWQAGFAPDLLDADLDQDHRNHESPEAMTLDRAAVVDLGNAGALTTTT